MKFPIILRVVLCFLMLNFSLAHSQQYVHQVLVLNEGYFDYTSNQSIIPPTIGSYDPSTEVYTTVDTLHAARFASDLIIDENYFYVAADNMLYKYDKDTYVLLASQAVDGIRNIAVWNDKLIVSRGDYDNLTFSPILFNSYLQIYNTNDLSLYTEIDTVLGPKWATQNLIVHNDLLYIGINNAYDWGNEKGLVGILDLNTFSYLNEVDLGPDGINPDNMMQFGDHIYTINNKDWTGSSISQISLLTNSVNTINLAAAPTGCGTSCLRDGKINFQISGDSVLNEWDISLLPNNGTATSINNFFYDLSHDHINNLLYASITDYTTTGSINIYDQDNILISSFTCGVSAGTIAFDIRGMINSVLETSMQNGIENTQVYDLLGKLVVDSDDLHPGLYLKNNKLFYKK